jgi:Na+-driven multidrug efflux pump
MSKVVLNFPTFGFVVATRAMIGAGLGLMVSDRLGADRRRKIGATLLAVGAATTIPALFAVFRGQREAQRLRESTGVVV